MDAATLITGLNQRRELSAAEARDMNRYRVHFNATLKGFRRRRRRLMQELRRIMLRGANRERDS